MSLLSVKYCKNKLISFTNLVNFFLFKQVNWKYNPGVKYYKFNIIYTKLEQC